VRDAGAERNEVRERREAVELAEGLLQLRIIFHVPEGFRVGILDTVTLKHIRRRHRFENELVDQRQDQRDEQRPLRLHRRLRGQPRQAFESDELSNNGRRCGIISQEVGQKEEARVVRERHHR